MDEFASSTLTDRSGTRDLHIIPATEAQGLVTWLVLTSESKHPVKVMYRKRSHSARTWVRCDNFLKRLFIGSTALSSELRTLAANCMSS